MGDRRAPRPITLVQDLVNSYDAEDSPDALDGADGLADFVTARGLQEYGLTTADLPALRDLREALRATCLAHAGSHPAEAAAPSLDGLLARAPLVLGVPADGPPHLRPAPGLTGAARFTARIAADIATSAADGTWQRLKACEAEDCRWVFYDRSPAGRGRWCSMRVCGSRAKMRAYRGRRRAGTP